MNFARYLLVASLLGVLKTTLSQDLTLTDAKAKTKCVGVGNPPDRIYNVTCTLSEGEPISVDYIGKNFCQASIRFTCSTASGVANCFLFKKSVGESFLYQLRPAQQPAPGSYVAGCFQQSSCDQTGLVNKTTSPDTPRVILYSPAGSSKEVKYSLECLDTLTSTAQAPGSGTTASDGQTLGITPQPAAPVSYPPASPTPAAVNTSPPQNPPNAVSPVSSPPLAQIAPPTIASPPPNAGQSSSSAAVIKFETRKQELLDGGCSLDKIIMGCQA